MIIGMRYLLFPLHFGICLRSDLKDRVVGYNFMYQNEVS